MAECVRTVSIRGFDAAGEPEIRVMADGSLQVLFNFMPPSDARDEEERLFERFEEHLSTAISVPVTRDDRELFLIDSPQDDTLDRLVQFLEQCRRLKMGPAAKPGVRGALHDGLTGLLAPHGFKLRKGEQSFVRAIPGGKQKLSVAWVDRRPQYQFSFFVGVRLDAVEEIVNRFAGLAPEFHRESTTTTTQLEYFGLTPERGRGVWFSVGSPEEVSAILRERTPLFQDQILPFFEQYQDVVALDQGLHPKASSMEADQPERKSFWKRWLPSRSPQPAPAPGEESAEAAWQRWEAERRAFDGINQPVRKMKGLVVAHQAGNPQYQEWLARYRAEMAVFPEADRQRFEALALYLCESSP